MPSPTRHADRLGSTLLILLTLLAAAFASARSLAGPPSEIARKVMPSVVLITTEDDKGQALARGSGFVVAEGVIATNLHVIRSASRAFVKVVNGETPLEVLGVVAENRQWDLVLLAVKDLNAPPLPIGDSAALQVGDDVYAVGNPHGLEGTFSAGIVSSIRRIEADALLQITAPISPGSSGGPIVNKDAEVVGVATLSVQEGQNLNFAVAAAQLAELLATRTDPIPLQAANGPTEETLTPASDSGLRAHYQAKKQAADEGDVEAIYHVGVFYLTGLGVDRDVFEALRYFRLAASMGHSGAMFTLGAIYERGNDVDRDAREAIMWYRKAADLGCTWSMCNLAVMYEAGDGVPIDSTEAVRWYHRAADLGNTSAMFNLGLMYDTGEGVSEDDSEAIKWYRKAAGLGHTGAIFNLGLMYDNGEGVVEDDREALKWYRKAADLGHTGAMTILGLMYAKGEGVAQDDRDAVEWLRKAADLGNSRAMFNLGVMYDQDRGTYQNDSEAVRWYRNAADLGHVKAMFNLGTMYAEGEGVIQDDIEAYAWFSVASALGLAEAREPRDLVATRLTAEARLTAQARAKERFERIEKSMNR